MSMEESIAWQRHLSQMWSGLGADLRYGDRETAEGAMRFLLRYPDNRTFVESSVLRVEFGYPLDESTAAPATRTLTGLRGQEPQPQGLMINSVHLFDLPAGLSQAEIEEALAFRAAIEEHIEVLQAISDASACSKYQEVRLGDRP